MIDTRISKLLGKTDPTLAAKTAPLNEARTAPTTKAINLELTVFIPITSATLSSSLMAIHARPRREPWSLHETYIAITQKARTI